ncbi:LysM peptidoglycan-binding domain-containing protein [Thiohalobacter sp. IOR34]|uniref:lytic transglycosylase n=1 Tax=Thiohalobacter sp. IOR34 TaxID=3057176 RepID=UPI0025B1E2E1|nr:LysM peptidoglycan-binding domain-containing protein [Thiohalobacter sp. IOR34]WJW74485.1 LysM peptidoglycan-binding domain-containing protein [Thiohalobacter sp. IOR34]
MRTGFALPLEDQPRIQAHLRWFQRHPDYLPRVLNRGRPYLGWILREVQRRDMPTEIALLPIVESGFNPFAYSHGRAAGLWQFIPATGRRFGLKQNWWYDGRRDLIDSTRAALDYLDYLHDHLDGDWMLALAAYNSGEGTVARALRRNRKAGKATDFWSLQLPSETRDYVPKLLALRQLVESPDRFGLELPPLEAAPQLVEVETGGQIDLALAAELAGIDLDRLYRLNPGFNRWATDPEGPHRLALPVENAEDFRTALAALPADRRIRWSRHQVARGETLSHIARRYHTTAALLSEVNALSGHRIRAGQHLLIPLAQRRLSDYRLSAAGRQQALQARSRQGQRQTHRVRPGDTLWDLSRKYRVGVRQLAAWNGMAPGDTLRVGQKLVVWTRHAAPSTARHPGQALQRISYRVRKGDSLARISQRFRISIADLRRWNKLGGQKYLQPGQRLTLYIDVTRQSGSS